MTLKVFLVWLVILFMAMVNGALREAFFIPVIGVFSAYLLSGFLLIICILLVAYFTLPWIGRKSVASYVSMGLGWLFMTLVFEFSLGLGQGLSWSQLVEAYLFRDGNIWSLVLLATALAPYMSAKIRGWV
ncbi:hypothetical protein [Methylophaga sp.]|uniref:hypothetical protein n=1 Tax=Methylophaga sp. TaxID=2024840 RepID=UPI003F6A4E83